jgi:RHS repeat-associated protein
MSGAETVVYYHTDALGSPAAVTDANRNVIERTQYAPYGDTINRPLHDGPGYTGHETDAATGLVYAQQRYYDPVLGRFLSVDPAIADANAGGNFNRYKYADNNPYKFTDPDGRATVYHYDNKIVIVQTFKNNGTQFDVPPLSVAGRFRVRG